jgi:hypothetical protein
VKTAKKRRPTYEELNRLLTLAEQQNRRLQRKCGELEELNVALAYEVNALGEKLFNLEWANIMRGTNARNLRQRGIN